jgi:hypothetical protein
VIAEVNVINYDPEIENVTVSTENTGPPTGLDKY